MLHIASKDTVLLENLFIMKESLLPDKRGFIGKYCSKVVHRIFKDVSRRATEEFLKYCF